MALKITDRIESMLTRRRVPIWIYLTLLAAAIPGAAQRAGSGEVDPVESRNSTVLKTQGICIAVQKALIRG
jgi:hypothetical protein